MSKTGALKGKRVSWLIKSMLVSFKGEDEEQTSATEVLLHKWYLNIQLTGFHFQQQKEKVYMENLYLDNWSKLDLCSIKQTNIW